MNNIRYLAYFKYSVFWFCLSQPVFDPTTLENEIHRNLILSC